MIAVTHPTLAGSALRRLFFFDENCDWVLSGIVEPVLRRFIASARGDRRIRPNRRLRVVSCLSMVETERVTGSRKPPQRSHGQFLPIQV